MKPIHPEELSAFLDGELSEQRMREVRQQLDRDDLLRGEFASLQALDRKWHAAAAEARFTPSIDLPKSVDARAQVLGVVAVGAALAGLRLASKVLDAEILIWMTANAAVLAGLLAATVWVIHRETERTSARS